MTGLVVYGDFNCPFSALASLRIDEIERRGLEAIEWHAVEHDTRIPSDGLAVTASLAAALAAELETIAGLLRPGEPDRLQLPPRQVNTALATRRFAGTPIATRSPARAAVFAAHWELDRRIDDVATLDDLGVGVADDAVAATWRAEWLATPDPIVPVLVLADGYVSRGLGALARLAAMLDG